MAVTLYEEGFGTGIVEMDLQLPSKKVKITVKIIGFKNGWSHRKTNVT